MINRNIGVRIISTNTGKLALFLIILTSNSNPMVAYPLADSQENGDVLNDLLLYSQLRGEGLRYPEEQQNGYSIFDDVSCYHQFINVWFLRVLMKFFILWILRVLTHIFRFIKNSKLWSAYIIEILTYWIPSILDLYQWIFQKACQPMQITLKSEMLCKKSSLQDLELVHISWEYKKNIRKWKKDIKFFSFSE